MGIILDVYRKVKAERARQRALDALLGSSLNYRILSELVNSAAHGAVIELTLHSGEKLAFRRETEYDKYRTTEAERRDYTIRAENR